MFTLKHQLFRAFSLENRNKDISGLSGYTFLLVSFVNLKISFTNKSHFKFLCTYISGIIPQFFFSRELENPRGHLFAAHT